MCFPRCRVRLRRRSRTISNSAVGLLGKSARNEVARLPRLSPLASRVLRTHDVRAGLGTGEYPLLKPSP